MLAEIQVPNADGALLPGMYAQVQLSEARTSTSPLVVPGDSLQVNADGTEPALPWFAPIIRFISRRLEVGRDYGDKLEVLSGLSEGDTIIPRPGDAIREGVKVDPVAAPKK